MITCDGQMITCGGHMITCGGHMITCGGHMINMDLYGSGFQNSNLIGQK